MVLPADAAPERNRALAAPAAVAHVAIGEQNLARGGQHQPDGEIGHLVGQNAGSVAHRDVAFARGGGSTVGSDAEDGDRLSSRGSAGDQRAVGAAIASVAMARIRP